MSEPEANLPEESVAAPNRPRRRLLWLPGVLVVALLLALVVAATIRASRPHWRAYVFPADPHSHIAVAIDYPDTLEIKSIPLNGTGTFQQMMGVGLRRKSPKGLARWWFEKILRQDVNPSRWESIQVMVMSPDFAPDMASIEKMGRRSPMTTSLRMERKRHPLGPALQMTTTINFALIARSPIKNGNFPSVLNVTETYIYPATPTGTKGMAIIVGCETSKASAGRLAASYDEIVRRIHLVRK